MSSSVTSEKPFSATSRKAAFRSASRRSASWLATAARGMPRYYLTSQSRVKTPGGGRPRLASDDGQHLVFRLVPGGRRPGRGEARTDRGHPRVRPVAEPLPSGPPLRQVPRDASRRRQPRICEPRNDPPRRRRGGISPTRCWGMMYLTSSPIEIASLLLETRGSDGGVCIFLGVVRNENEGRE